MRALSPRIAAVAVVCMVAGLPVLSVFAESRPSELTIRSVPPAAESQVERFVPGMPLLLPPLQATPAEDESAVKQATFETSAPTAAEVPAAAPAIHPESAGASQPAASPVSWRPPVFPGRPPVVQMPRRMTIQPAPQRTARRPAKPFKEYQPDPTISPYLNMYRDEDEEEGVPNYFAFVRPVFEQQELNRAQQQQLQQLRGQIQNASSGAGSVPATGLRARYMDTAQFYGTRQR